MISGDLLASTASMALGDAAGHLAAAGIPVFPCVSESKKPMTKHGFLDATTDLDAVRLWWRQWPRANIGIPTGGRSGMDVVDIDVHNAPGPVSVHRAAQAGLVGGWFATVRTPSGGMHAYYPCHPDCRQPSWQAAKAGIDFRGAGGYIVAPPSRGPGGLVGYEVLAVATESGHPIDASALRDFLDPRPIRPPARQVRGQDLNAERLAAWVAARRVGERNRGLFWAACRLAEQGIDPATMLTVLGPAAEQAGLPAPEITSTIRSACRTTATASLPPPSDDHGHRRTLRAVEPRGLS